MVLRLTKILSSAKTPGLAQPPRRRANIMVLTLIMLPALFAVISLAIDYGRVQLAKSELQTAADAAVTAAIARLHEGWSYSRAAATEVAAANRCDGTSVALNPTEDVVFGRWSAKTRKLDPVVGYSTANAIQVTARRTAARGNPIVLPIARLIGMPQADVVKTAVAVRLRYSLVGIDSIQMKGTSIIDSYDSAYGPYGPSNNGDRVTAISNGNIDLGSNCAIRGDALPGPNCTVTGAASVTGSTDPLPQKLSFPMPTIDPSFNNGPIQSWLDGNGDMDLKGTNEYVIPPGVYSVRSIKLASTSTLVVQGGVTLYVAGDIDLRGGIKMGSLPPADFKIRVVTGGTNVSIVGNSALSADLYAPGSDVSLVGTGDFSGTLVGKTLSLSGVTGVHGDESLAPYGGSGVMRLVR